MNSWRCGGSRVAAALKAIMEGAHGTPCIMSLILSDEVNG
jgi:hypothetical protein